MNKVQACILFLVLTLSLQIAYCQNAFQDSLVANFKYKESFYYVKPVFGLIYNRPDLDGNSQFMHTYNSALVNTNKGLLAGYSYGKVALEFGVIDLPIATGYRVALERASGRDQILGHTFRVRYYSFPLLFHYTLYEVGRRLTVKSSAGIIFIRYFNFIRFGNNAGTAGITATTPDGVTWWSRTDYVRNYRESFRSGILGVDLQYRAHKNITFNLQANKLINPQDILTYNASITHSDSPEVYKVKTSGKANGVNLTLGVQYNFQVRKVYKEK